MPLDKKINFGQDDMRCTCGRLIARRKERHYEVKCPRCKEHVQLPCSCGDAAGSHP